MFNNNHNGDVTIGANNIQIFNSEQFGQIRAIAINGEPWFVAIDVCRVLEIKNNRDALSRLDDDEKGVALVDTLGGRQEMSIVNEPGLYSLVLGSRKKEAKAFKRWITHEVIPSIRKHGAYIAGQESMTREQLISKALIAANEIMDEQNRKIAMLESKVEADAHKVDFYDAVEASVNAVSMGGMSKLLQNNNIDVGRNRLIDIMINHGYAMRDGGNIVPTQKAINLGILEAKETYYICNGNRRTRITSVFTGKGQTYMVKKWFDIFA